MGQRSCAHVTSALLLIAGPVTGLAAVAGSLFRRSTYVRYRARYSLPVRYAFGSLPISNARRLPPVSWPTMYLARLSAMAGSLFLRLRPTMTFHPDRLATSKRASTSPPLMVPEKSVLPVVEPVWSHR